MTFSALKDLLNESQLFTEGEVAAIISACGTATIGNAIVACSMVGIYLTGDDIDILLNMLNN